MTFEPLEVAIIFLIAFVLGWATAIARPSPRRGDGLELPPPRRRPRR